MRDHGRLALGRTSASRTKGFDSVAMPMPPEHHDSLLAVTNADKVRYEWAVIGGNN
jgi:hypothetical protein